MIHVKAFSSALASRGARWKDVLLVMFTVYIDDSGTDPNQPMAIASALIIPAARVVALDKEWEKLTKKEGFTEFHTSECVWLNEDSEFAKWDAHKQKRVISRVRQIGKKFGVQAMSLAITKADYNELVPDWLRELAGKYHYTWAIRNMLDMLDKWAAEHRVRVPFEYIYDWMDPKAQKKAKAEIDTVMAQAEEGACARGDSGRYTNYSFRKRLDIPALQCTDALAWTCYQFACFVHNQIPLSEIAQESWNDYHEHHPKAGWLYAGGMKKEHLKEWVDKESKAPRTIERYETLKVKQDELKRLKQEKKKSNMRTAEDV